MLLLTSLNLTVSYHDGDLRSSREVETARFHPEKG